MSNFLAIAAVTATLRSLLSKVSDSVPGTTVTSRPLDRARANTVGNQLNIFLYQAVPNAAWRNQEVPQHIRPGEAGRIPLALNLYYLVTAFGDNDDEVLSQSLLGQAMAILSDHPVLQPVDIQAALPGSGLHDQVERVRIAPHSLSVEDISKLWTAFQTQYRVTAAYQVAVVLIDSELPARSPLPVLQRGSEDRGPVALASASPSLTQVLPDLGRPGLSVAARLGDDLLVEGDHLEVGHLSARFSHRLLAEPIVLGTSAGAGGSVRVHLPNLSEDNQAFDRWTPGFYALALTVDQPGVPPWVTNDVPMALAPIITVAPKNAQAGDLNLDVTCAPRLRAGQQVLLLFGDRQVPAGTVTNPTDISLPTTITFSVKAVKAGAYIVRLRVDGVDSLPVPMPMPAAPHPLEFDADQQVMVT